MLIYIAFFVSAVIIYLMTYNKGNQSKGILAGYLAILAIFVGIADMLGGYDRYIYGELFDEISEMMRNGENILTSQLFTLYPKEVGYDFLNVAIGLFTQNRYVFIFIVTVIIYINVFFSLQKYTDNYPFATILFMGFWFFFTFTYLRQVIAASVAWLAIQYAIDRKPWKFFGIVISCISYTQFGNYICSSLFFPHEKNELANSYCHYGSMPNNRHHQCF
jgi:hypothetical protein